MAAFEFATAQRIKFGPGCIRQLAGLIGGFGRRIALATGEQALAASGRMAEIETQLREAGIAWQPVTIGGEPTVEKVDALTASLREFAPEVVVAIGGGSVLDAGKALAALLTNGGSALDYLEGVGRGATLSKPSLPCIAAPTTAGTGSEVTRNAVIGDTARTFKKSMRSATMLPALALVDPELTDGCSPEVRAACGMDALTQLIESYTSPRGSPLTDSLALQGLGHAAELPFLMADPTDTEARDAVALASLLGGMCLANAGLGAVHGLASPLGAYHPIPHGVACAALLPPVVRMNVIRALEQDLPALVFKYAAIFEVLAGASNDEDSNDEDQDLTIEEEELNVGVIPMAEKEWSEEADDAEDPDEPPSDEQIDLALAADNAMQLVHYLEGLRSSFKLPGLGKFGIKPAAFDRIIDESGGTSMQTNPVKLTPDDLAQILEASL